jgi:phage-related protein
LGVLGFWTVFAQGSNGVREEEKSELAHPSCGVLFFTRLYHLQAAGKIRAEKRIKGNATFIAGDQFHCGQRLAIYAKSGILMVDERQHEKPLFWIGRSYDDLLACPTEVRRTFGFALGMAQQGGKFVDSKPLKGFGGAGVLEIVENWEGDTFRCVYTVKFARAVYVLHTFQKKAKKGIGTPQQEIELVKARLKSAEEHYSNWSRERRIK